MQLLINLHEDELRTYTGGGLACVERTRGAAVSGAYSGLFAIDTDEQRSIAGVTFRSGVAFPFFRPPADALSANHVELDALWGRDGAVLRERLLEVRTPDATCAPSRESSSRARCVHSRPTPASSSRSGSSIPAPPSGASWHAWV